MCVCVTSAMYTDDCRIHTYFNRLNHDRPIVNKPLGRIFVRPNISIIYSDYPFSANEQKRLNRNL